ATLPNGREVLAAHGERRITLWDVRHRRVLREIDAAGTRTLDLAATGAGRLVVAALGTDGNIRVWDGVTGQRLWRRPGGPGAGLSVAALSDGRAIVASSVAYGVRVRDALTG